jgi:hypothetical protein
MVMTTTTTSQRRITDEQLVAYLDQARGYLPNLNLNFRR